MKKKGFCEFHSDLYWGASVKKHSLVKWRLLHGRGQFTVFCLTKPMNNADQLEIIHCAFLKQPYFLEHPAYVYGIAGGYREALDLVVRISDEAAQNGFEGRLLDYLER